MSDDASDSPNHMRRLFLRVFIALSPVLCLDAKAQINYSGGVVTQDFNTLPVSGSFTAAGTAPVPLTAAPFNGSGASGWTIGAASSTSAKLNADGGASATGSHSSYGTGTQAERALGFLASGSYTGRAGLTLVNNSATPLTQFTITFTGKQWRNGGSGTANTLAFSYSLNAADISTGTFTAVTSLDFTSPIVSLTAAALDGNSAANRVSITATVSNVPWGVGQTLIIRWTDTDNTGSDDGLAIDDFSFSAIQFPLPVITRIHTVQDDVVSSPMVGQMVTLEAVVTGDHQGGITTLGGFYLQELAASADGDAATSEGIFVADAGASASIDVAVGDVVQVTGTVAETSAITSITNPTFIVKAGTATPPAPTVITMPASTLSGLERYEGMLVSINQTLTVAGNEVLGSEGELTLAVSGAVDVPTDFIDPNDSPASGTSSTGTSNVAAVTAQDSLNRRRMITLDDASRRSYPGPTPWLNAQNTRRCGDTVAGVTGFISYANGENKIQPAAAVIFTDANPRSALAPTVGGRIKVAGMNALNYFLTFGSRGASSATELQRQRDKLVAEIIGLDADVVGFMEIENTGTTALDNLMNAVNSALGSVVYAHVPEPASTGGDVIRVAMIYKPAVVTPGAMSFSDADPVWNRHPLAVVFTENNSGARFIACANHFKSKSSGGASGANLDQGDGQGAFNDQRKQQAARLVTFLNTVRTSAGTTNVLVFGDLNAYSQEDSIDILRAAGYATQSSGTHSYIFDGARGHLDHVMASASLAMQVTAAATWHINADEPSYLDYNLENKSAAQQALNTGTPYRSSDHDPVLIGLTLTPPAITYASWSANITWPPGANTTPNGDADHDGACNLEELMSGTNPLLHDLHLRPAIMLSGATLQLDYRHKSNVTSHIAVPQWSPNLSTWTDLAPGAVVSTLDPTLNIRRVVLNVSAETSGFVRIDFR